MLEQEYISILEYNVWGGEHDTRTNICTYSTFLNVVVTVQLSHRCYLYSIYDTFRVALTYRSKNI